MAAKLFYKESWHAMMSLRHLCLSRRLSFLQIARGMVREVVAQMTPTLVCPLRLHKLKSREA